MALKRKIPKDYKSAYHKMVREEIARMDEGIKSNAQKKFEILDKIYGENNESR